MMKFYDISNEPILHVFVKFYDNMYYNLFFLAPCFVMGILFYGAKMLTSAKYCHIWKKEHVNSLNLQLYYVVLRNLDGGGVYGGGGGGGGPLNIQLPW